MYNYSCDEPQTYKSLQFPKLSLLWLISFGAILLQLINMYVNKKSVMAGVVKKKRKDTAMAKLGDLEKEEVFCYICRSILIKPVSMPCSHVLCLACFEQSMQETSYTCPLCRKRISNWVRTAKKRNTLVNEKLWSAIKSQFEQQVVSKLQGEDDGLDAHMQEQDWKPPSNLAEPGETAKEFQNLLNNIQSEQRKIQLAQERASVDLINRLAKEDEEYKILLMAETEKDEEMARQIQNDLDKQSTPGTSHQGQSRSSSKQKKVTKGPLDDFFKAGLKNGLKQPPCPENARSGSADSTDSICSELHHFKPISVAPKTPPKQWPDGMFLSVTFKRVSPDPKPIESKVTSPSKKIQSPFSAFILKGGDSSPRKRLRFSTEDSPGESGVLKEINLEENSSDSNSMEAETECRQTDERHRKAKENVELVEEQRRIAQMIVQEKADRELALRLSREWETERNTYELRRKPRKSQQMNCKKQQTLLETMVLRNKK